MRKGIKILGKVISATLLLLIIFPLLLSLLLDIPSVQNFVVHKAAQLVSRQLETTVSIERVDIGLFNKIKVYGFYVEDYQRDTLLYARRVDALISNFGFSGGGLALSHAQIDGAKLYLRETPSGEMNIKEVVDRMSNKEKTEEGTFKLSIKAVRISNMDFCLERLDRQNPEFGIDFAHLHLYGLALRATNFEIEDSSIAADITTLSARERSGFLLEDLSGHFYLTGGGLGFEHAQIITAASNITLPYVSLIGDSWAEYKDFVQNVRIDASLIRSTLSTEDLAYFAPKMRSWHTCFRNMDLDVAGTVSDFTSSVRSLNLDAATSLTTRMTVRGLPDFAKTHFDLDITQLVSASADLDRLAASVGGRALSDKLLTLIDNTGRLQLGGRFVGTPSAFTTNLNLATAVGNLACNVFVTPGKGGTQRVKGGITAREIRLGTLLDEPRLGRTSLTAHIDGVVGRGNSDANVMGEITQLEFNGYRYDSLRLKGHFRNKEFDGVVTARDADLNFDFAGVVDLNNEIPEYDFTLDLHKVDLAKMKLNLRDSVSLLSAHVKALASGRSLDDLNGRIEVTDADYYYNDQQLKAKRLTITGENTAGSKLVELQSDFADATFRSRTSYREVVEYLKMSARKYLPTLYDSAHELSGGGQETAVANDYSLLSVVVRNINPLADAISPGLQVADGSQLRLLFNPADDKLSFRATSDYLEHSRLLATRLNINADNRGDSLVVYASAEDLYAGAVHLPHLSVMGGARKGKLQISTGFNDTLRKFSGMIGLRAQVAPQDGDNGRVVELHVLPSHITKGDKTWQIYARQMLLDTARVVIDRFVVMNDEQELLLDGVASRSRQDSVLLRLRNFDLAPFTQIVDKMGYSIEGTTNGSAVMKSALRTGEITASITLDSLRVNNIPAPPLQLLSRWDLRRNRAGIAVMNRQKRDTLIRGFYVPSQVRYYASLSVDSLDMGLLDPILQGVVSGTRGQAKVDLRLSGERRKANLEGNILVSGLSTTVDFTQATYSMPQAELKVVGNRFTATNIPIFDSESHQGRFDMDLSLNHLSNIAYNIRVAPQQMIVLNTKERDNNLFYGKVYATGLATIKGDKRGVNMDITATTNDKSSFNMPLSSKSNISNADFVTFETVNTLDTTNYLIRKKMSFERKQRIQDKVSSNMDINLSLNVNPHLDFQLVIDPTSGSTIKGRGDGVLNLHINPRANVFEMYGDYTITEGNYLFTLQNLINRKFIIDGGSTIQWTGDPLNAMLNIDAIYKLKASLTPLLQGTTNNTTGDRSVPVECLIHLGDRLTNPSISFGVKVPAADPEMQSIIANALSTPETMDTQFLYLLVFNSFLSDSNAANANIGVSASAATGLEFLSNQLSSWLSADDYNVVIRYRPKSELSSDEVDFGLSKSLINNRLFVEVEGNYVMNNKQAVNRNISNFMGEAYITWLIDRAGTLKLKGFTQTIDRFDENQGLQETGIGIYYKEDFNNFRDLRQRIKDRFTSKKRKEKRAARAAEKLTIKENRKTENNK